MTNEPSPRQWRYDKACSDIWAVYDANGGFVCDLTSERNAALIVDAVNYYKPDLHCDWCELTPEDAVAHCREVAARLGDTPCARDHLQLAAWIEERDSLRDIVRRMLPFVEFSIDAYRPTSERRVELTREARAAIGEDTK